jgi:hypothetical protein
MRKLILFFLIVVSCSPAEKAKNNLEQLNKFVVGVETGCASYTDRNWAEADSTINVFRSFFDDGQLILLSAGEREEYNRLIGEYRGMKTAYASRKFLETVKSEVVDFGNKARGFAEGVIKTIDTAILK